MTRSLHEIMAKVIQFGIKPVRRIEIGPGRWAFVRHVLVLEVQHPSCYLRQSHVKRYGTKLILIQ